MTKFKIFKLTLITLIMLMISKVSYASPLIDYICTNSIVDLDNNKHLIRIDLLGGTQREHSILSSPNKIYSTQFNCKEKSRKGFNELTCYGTVQTSQKIYDVNLILVLTKQNGKGFIKSNLLSEISGDIDLTSINLYCVNIHLFE